MKIVMTGATGLLGNELGQELVRRGHELIVLSRSRKRALAKLSFPCEIVEWHKNKISDHPLFSKAEALIHLAGEGIADRRWSKSRKRILRSSRIQTAQAVVAKLKEENAPIAIVMTASGVGIYGDRGDDVLLEVDPPGKDFVSRLCVDWEAATKDVFPKARWVALRTAPVLSKKGGYLAQILPIFRRAGASVLGDGRQFFSWIHISDWTRLAIWCFEAPDISGPVNATSMKPVRNSAWTKMLKESLAVFPNFPVPQIVLRLVFGELALVMLNSQRAVPAKAIESGFKFEFPDGTSALKDLFGDVSPSAIAKIFRWTDSRH